MAEENQQRISRPRQVCLVIESILHLSGTCIWSDNCIASHDERGGFPLLLNLQTDPLSNPSKLSAVPLKRGCICSWQAFNQNRLKHISQPSH